MFDRVVIHDGRRRAELTVEQFLALPLHERVRCVLDRTTGFFRGDTVVERRAALSSLRALQTG